MNEFLKTMLEISGVLFGLTFAAISYAHQSVTTTYSYCKDIFIDLYTEYSKLILVPLGFVFILSIKVLFLNSGNEVVVGSKFDWIDGVIIFLFSILFIKIRLDYYRSLGYIHTIFSSKLVPSNYGKVRSYFRQISNLGFVTGIRIRLGFLLIIGYPLWIGINRDCEFIGIDKTVTYLLVFMVVYVLFKIIAFIPITTSMQKLQVKKKFEAAKPNDIMINKVKEFELLEQYLISRGVDEQGIFHAKKTTYGTVYCDVLKNQEKAEGWINVFHKLESSDIEIDKNGVFEYVYALIKILSNSKNDIDTFVMSNHITFENGKKENLFVRIKRSEMLMVLSAGNPEIAIKSLDSVIINEMFK